MPWHASQDVLSRSSIHPRNCFDLVSKRITKIRRVTRTDLRHALLQERHRERAILDANPHELRRVAADIPKLYTVLANTRRGQFIVDATFEEKLTDSTHSLNSP